MVSKQQIKKIYALAREQGLDDEVLHSVVYRETQKEHISELSKAEAVRVIDVLILDSAAAKIPIHLPTNRASTKQISFIQGLAKDMGWNDKRLLGFVKNVGRVDALNWLDKNVASNVIEGMKKLKEKGAEFYGERNGADGSE